MQTSRFDFVTSSEAMLLDIRCNGVTDVVIHPYITLVW